MHRPCLGEAVIHALSLTLSRLSHTRSFITLNPSRSLLCSLADAVVHLTLPHLFFLSFTNRPSFSACIYCGCFAVSVSCFLLSFLGSQLAATFMFLLTVPTRNPVRSLHTLNASCNESKKNEGRLPEARECRFCSTRLRPCRREKCARSMRTLVTSPGSHQPANWPPLAHEARPE
jgi:hypothetical protein